MDSLPPQVFIFGPCFARQGEPSLEIVRDYEMMTERMLVDCRPYD